MDNVIDLIATGAKASEVSDAIKASLYAKTAERIDAARPIVAASFFDSEEQPETEEPQGEE